MKLRSGFAATVTLFAYSLISISSISPAKADSPCYTVADGVLTDGTGCIGEVIIDESVTSIGEDAFKGAATLTSINIPNSVTSIGRAAFWGTNLSTVVIPESVTSISAELFRTTKSLTSVTIPSAVTEIKNFAFDGTGLTSITIPSTVTTIGMGAFKNTNLISIIIPNSVNSIGQSAFENTINLKTATFQGSLESLTAGIFEGAKSLSTITFPPSLKWIEAGAFYGTGFSTIVIPGSVETIYQYAFASMPYLKTAVIQEGVNTVLHGAFSGDPLLSTVVIPNSATAVGGISDVNDDPFRDPVFMVSDFVYEFEPIFRLVSERIYNDSLFALDTSLSCVTYPVSMTIINNALNGIPRCPESVSVAITPPNRERADAAEKALALAAAERAAAAALEQRKVEIARATVELQTILTNNAKPDLATFKAAGFEAVTEKIVNKISNELLLVPDDHRGDISVIKDVILRVSTVDRLSTPETAKYIKPADLVAIRALSEDNPKKQTITYALKKLDPSRIDTYKELLAEIAKQEAVIKVRAEKIAAIQARIAIKGVKR